jgi:hypothetical protein
MAQFVGAIVGRDFPGRPDLEGNVGFDRQLGPGADCDRDHIVHPVGKIRRNRADFAHQVPHEDRRRLPARLGQQADRQPVSGDPAKIGTDLPERRVRKAFPQFLDRRFQIVLCSRKDQSRSAHTHLPFTPGVR